MTRINRPAVNLLPGPVEIHPSVRRAFADEAVSHRGAGFLAEIAELRARLAAWVGARHVELLLGSGTLANDAVAAQLSLRDDRGLILVNGEFGSRLTDHARRFGLAFDPEASEWGQPLDYERAARRLAEGAYGWIWAVHCETSTGILNDLERLKALARDSGTDLCLDCISSLGTVPLDLAGVCFATANSSKGVASFPGLAMVFHHHSVESSPRLPRYLDLGVYAADNVPYTTSSNLIRALAKAVDRFHDRIDGDGGPPTFEDRQVLAGWLRGELGASGWQVLAPAAHSSPVVFSLVVPKPVSSLALGETLESEGYFTSYRSRYLIERNLLQICLMSTHSRGDLEPLLAALGRQAAVLAPTA